MAFDDQFRLSVHAVFTDEMGKILQLRSTYDGNRWGLPGGSLEPGETIHEALIRECHEELGVNIDILYMSGMYFHKAYHSHACIFRCDMQNGSEITLSAEHSDYRYFTLDELSAIQRHRVLDCLQFDGKVKSEKF
ncbi:MAG: NUDIX domain-containing protein [Legionellales bacterium]|nr:NUDIX domain-containing protein [Legionellales bacterium]